jgi:uncharacterized surface protein with fasciclin (FAS1) repeats
MYPTRTIVQNAINSKDHTTLVAAVKAAGLVDTLNGAGPFTVFAPTNAAFSKLPAGTVDTLVKPENKAQLTKILTYHVVPGNYSSAQLMADARKHGGKATLKTVEGESSPSHCMTASCGSSMPRAARRDQHCRRRPVQWRDPRDRHRVDAEVVACSRTST